MNINYCTVKYIETFSYSMILNPSVSTNWERKPGKPFPLTLSLR